MPKKTQRICVGLSPDEYEELKRIAEKHHLSVAWIGRQAIAEFLLKYEKTGSVISTPTDDNSDTK